VEHAQHHAARARLERELDAGRARMPRHVREALLRHPVDRQLRLLGQRRQALAEAALDLEAALLREPARELRERAYESEVLEHLGPQLAGDAAHLVERLPHGLLRLL